MSEARVKTRLWIQMALRRGTADGKPGAVLHHGDDDAGGILLLLRSRGGFLILSQTRDPNGKLAWLRVAEAADQGKTDAIVDRQRRSDPDLWVIEFEAPDGLPPFEARIL